MSGKWERRLRRTCRSPGGMILTFDGNEFVFYGAK